MTDSTVLSLEEMADWIPTVTAGPFRFSASIDPMTATVRVGLRAIARDSRDETAVISLANVTTIHGPQSREMVLLALRVAVVTVLFHEIDERLTIDGAQPFHPHQTPGRPVPWMQVLFPLG